MVVELDDHHDSDLINAGLAADAGYRGTFRHEAEQDLEELRATFRRKAHTAAMERCLTALLRCDQPDRDVTSLGAVTLADLPPGEHTEALRRRRSAARPAGRPGRAGAGRRTTATATRPRRSRCGSAGPGPPGSRSTATRTSAAGCCAPATRVRTPTRRLGPTNDPAFIPLTTVQAPKEHTS